MNESDTTPAQDQDTRLRRDLKRRLRLAGFDSDLTAVNDVTALRQFLDRVLIYQLDQPVEVSIGDTWRPGTFRGYERPTGEDFRRLSVRLGVAGSIHDLAPERVRPVEAPKSGGIDPNDRCSSFEQHGETGMVRACSLPAGHGGRHQHHAIPGSIGPFPVEPAFGSPEAVAQAAETSGADPVRPSRGDLILQRDELLRQRDELADALAAALSAIENLDFRFWEACGHDSSVYREATGAPSLAEAAAVLREALEKAGWS